MALLAEEFAHDVQEVETLIEEAREPEEAEATSLTDEDAANEKSTSEESPKSELDAEASFSSGRKETRAAAPSQRVTETP